MKTITLQIGNSDDRLSQARWSAFVAAMREVVAVHGREIHFFGAPPNWEPWQNVAWVVTCQDEHIPGFIAAVQAVRRDFGQDAVAWTEGETRFL
jgi:hypothetical protein